MAHGEPAVVTRVTDPAPRRVRRRAQPPGTRAIAGGLLMALSAVGVFVAYADASQGPSDPIVISRHAVRIGDVLGADDLRVVMAELPGGTAGTFSSVDELVGRVALGPIGAGEIVQRASVTDDRGTPGTHEIELTLPRQQIAVGHLKQGERVDVFVTRDERTSSVVRGATVVQIGTGRDGSLTSDRELSIVVAAPSAEAVAALVHALRTGDVTVVRATFATSDEAPVEVPSET